MRRSPFNKTHLLFLIILIEGYVVLASELLAIRQLIPFVGSGTETIAIIISGVLLPLAIGYDAGGRAFTRHWRRHQKRGGKTISIRKILLKNIICALAILGFGLSYPFLEIFFGILTMAGIHHRLPQTALYVTLFIVYPVYLLGQTVPLVSNYFSRRRLSEITGKMLFFSTTGSFLGSIFSTIVLMMHIGVNNTVIVTLGLLFALALLLSRRLLSYEPVLAIMLLGLIATVNGNDIQKSLNIVSNNAYNIVSVMDIEKEGSTLLNINRSASSKVNPDREKHFEYWKFVEKNFIATLGQNPQAPKKILIIGAGGFTIGLDDKVNAYTFVDIDPALKKISEEYFLKEKLTPNKQFVAESARAFVHGDKEKYDFILLDAYTNMISIPMECITREFLLDVKARLNKGGVVIANVISTPAFEDRFTIRYDNTFSSVFPKHTRQIIDKFDPWPQAENKPHAMRARNVLYIYMDREGLDDTAVYTDNHNTFSIDR